MPRERAPGCPHDEPRGLLVPVVRRARLGFLLIWRTYRPPTEEIDARKELSAVRARAIEEMRLAAEEYRWSTLDRNRETVRNEE
jgi:hypothetical protein